MAGEAGSSEEELPRLLEAVARGDRQAFRAVYERTSAKLFGIILRIVRDRALAEEVLQDVFMRIWQNASGYSPDVARPMTWLISIARYRAIDVARTKREVLPGPTEDGEAWMSFVPDPRNSEAQIVNRDALYRCLSQLEETHRHCIVLAYCEGYSREELAARFERPVNTIKTWLHRGLAALRTCLDR